MMAAGIVSAAVMSSWLVVAYAAVPLPSVATTKPTAGEAPVQAVSLRPKRAPAPRDERRAPIAAAVAKQRREQEDLRRQDLAAELAQMGLSLQWQDYTTGDLADWRDRMHAAHALRADYGVAVDWRFSSLSELTDMRLRAAKASELSSAYGVHVDWQRYSWAALESLRRELGRLPIVEPNAQTPFADDALALPGLAQRNRGARSFRSKDPDALLRPTFDLNAPQVWSRRASQATRADPDRLMVPAFVSIPPIPVGPDDVVDPWNPFGIRRSATEPVKP